MTHSREHLNRKGKKQISAKKKVRQEKTVNEDPCYTYEPQIRWQRNKDWWSFDMYIYIYIYMMDTTYTIGLMQTNEKINQKCLSEMQYDVIIRTGYVYTNFAV